MGIPDHLPCLLRNLYTDQEATVSIGHGTTDWLKTGKREGQGCVLSPCYLTYMQNTVHKMPGWMKYKLESRFPEEISITSGMQMKTPLSQEVERN